MTLRQLVVHAYAHATAGLSEHGEFDRILEEPLEGSAYTREGVTL